MKFTYRWGQRPLEGYTLKRGLGQGGFGEVYFAVSDGGKEVALKLIRGHNDVELRGIANCLNFKHPHLVHLYDLRTDSQGDRWLVMEYIQGEPLSAILQRHPRGMPESQAREWFLQAAQAVAYLHDHAVIHRDIKPGNLFVENGLVKLGDYGLSKSVGVSHHAQSSNVGTVHYMAPEVASGSYSRQIDIYACGVMLYEMLTGEVPFKGESWAEIAIKHQTDLPDLSKIPLSYCGILEKALNKKADRRFATVSEMIEAVEAVGPPTKRGAPRLPQPAAPAEKDTLPVALVRGRRRKLMELSKSLVAAPLLAVPASALWAMFSGIHWDDLASLFLIVVAVSWSVLLSARLWEGRKSSMARRVTLGLFGMGIGCLAFWLNGWTFPELWLGDEPLPMGVESHWGGTLRGERGAWDVLSGYVLFFTLALFAPRWWLSAERKRREPFTLYPLIVNVVWGMILLRLCFSSHAPSPPGYLVLALAGAAAIVQLVSPHVPPAPAKSRFRRRLVDARADN